MNNCATALGLAAVTLACGTPNSERGEDATEVRPAGLVLAGSLELGVMGRANAYASLASRDDFVVAAWSAATPEGSADIFSAVSRNGGVSFSDPVRVNSDIGTARVSGEQPPRLALHAGDGRSDPWITLIWTAAGDEGTRLMTSTSLDGGRSYGASTLVTGTDAAGNRGWESLAAFADGRVVSAWLDHRQLADDAASTHHQHGADSEADGVAMAQRSQLYFGLLGGAAPRPLTGGVCYCCKTALATGPFGTADAVAIAWRHVYPGNLRDIAFTVSRDGGTTFTEPVRVSEDQWSIAGCPDDGPSMAVDAEGRAHLVWPTVATEGTQATKVLFHSMTPDGTAFSARVRVPSEGQANHPQIAIGPDGALFAIWDESGSGTRRIAAARGVLEGNQMVFERLTQFGGETGVYPVLASGERLLSAWTAGPAHSSTIHVIRLQKGFR